MKWIAIDFGTYEIKLLLAEVDGQKIQMEGFATFESKPDHFKGLAFADSAAWAAVTIRLNELEWLKPDEDVTVIAALPSSYLETRYLKFPFRSEKKIEKVLGFELESVIPFDLETIQVRSKVLDGDGVVPVKKDGLVMAMAYKRDPIRQFESELRKFQLSIPPITVEILALSSLRQAITDLPVFGILQVGHSKSEFLLLQKSGGILGLRTFWWGGKTLIDTLASEMSVDAKRAKQMFMEVLNGQKPMTPMMDASVHGFATDLRQTLKGIQSEGILLPKPLPVLTIGSLGRLAPVREILEARMRTNFDLHLADFPMMKLVERQIRGFELLSDSSASEKGLPALAMLMSQTRQNRGRIPSFSESGFQLQRNLKKLKSGSFSILKKVAMLLIAPFLFAVINFVITEKENSQILAKLSSTLQRAGFDVKKSEPTDEIVARMQKEVTRNRQKISQMNSNSSSPVQILAQISNAIPTYIKVDVKEFKVSESSVLLTAETPTEASAQQIESTLKQKFPNLKVGNISDCEGSSTKEASKKDCKSMTIEIERTMGG